LANLEAFKKQKEGAAAAALSSSQRKNHSVRNVCVVSSRTPHTASLNKTNSMPTTLSLPLGAATSSTSSTSSAPPPISPSRSGGSLVKQIANRMRDKSPSPSTSPRSDDEGSAPTRSKGSLLGKRLKLAKNRMTVHGATPVDPGSASTSPRAVRDVRVCDRA
jgi:hypothetical protein